MDDLKRNQPNKVDTRRFQIYMQVNDHDRVKIQDLKLSEYLKFKLNDQYVEKYCRQFHLKENEIMEKLYRSLDDVDYTMVTFSSVEGTNAGQIYEFPENEEIPRHHEVIVGFNNTTDSEITVESSHTAVQNVESSHTAQTVESSHNVQFDISAENSKLKLQSPIWDHVLKIKKGKEIALQCGTQADKVTNAIMFMICKDLLPISIVENEGFQVLLKVLVPLYEPPSKKTITKKLEARYKVLKENFIDQIKEINHYCITCDNWKDCSNQTYIGITIHFLKVYGYNQFSNGKPVFRMYSVRRKAYQ